MLRMCAFLVFYALFDTIFVSEEFCVQIHTLNCESNGKPCKCESIVPFIYKRFALINILTICVLVFFRTYGSECDIAVAMVMMTMVMVAAILTVGLNENVVHTIFITLWPSNESCFVSLHISPFVVVVVVCV